MNRSIAATRAATLPRLKLLPGILGSALFGTLLGAIVVVLVSTHFFGYDVLTIRSFSMEPSLSKGDLVVTRPVTIEDVKAGQVVLFEEGRDTKILVAHRVQNLVEFETKVVNATTGTTTVAKQTLLRTKGDANKEADQQLVDAASLRGRVWFTLPGAGTLFDNFSLQNVLFALAGVTFAAWIAYELLRRRRRRAKGQPSP